MMWAVREYTKLLLAITKAGHKRRALNERAAALGGAPLGPERSDSFGTDVLPPSLLADAAARRGADEGAFTSAPASPPAKRPREDLRPAGEDAAPAPEPQRARMVRPVIDPKDAVVNLNSARKQALAAAPRPAEKVRGRTDLPQPNGANDDGDGGRAEQPVAAPSRRKKARPSKVPVN